MELTDRATKDFASKLAEEVTLADELKALKTVAKVIQNPTKALPRLAQKTLLDATFKKEGAPRPGSEPVKMFGYMNEHFGQAWWEWEPETLRARLGARMRLTDEVMNLVQALQLVAGTDAPFEHWHVFEKVGHAFAGGIVDFQVMQPLEPDEVAFAYRVLSKLRPHAQFDEEVAIYMAVCCHHAGMVYLPPDLFPPAADLALRKMTHEKNLEVATEASWKTGQATDNPVLAHQLELLHMVRERAKKAA